MKYFFTIIFLLLIKSVSAQEITFIGKVVDSLNTPLQYANVMAIKIADQSIGAFAITDLEGKFKLILTEGERYTIKVSFVGFVSFERSFTANEQDSDIIIIELTQDTKLLSEVQVVHEMPVVMSGDTLVYKTDAFTNGRERKLEDVLEKLPGIEVDENGEVKVQGKKVNKLLVEGKQFFDGDTKMGVKNIPANAIDRVQVLRDFNEVGPMDGLQGEDNLALNIKLKEGKKNLVFGDATLGGGPEHRYMGHLNAFLFTKKLNLNLIADANNVGNTPFTMQDYMRFSGGVNEVGTQSGSSIWMQQDMSDLPMASRENAYELKTNLTAFNFNYSPSKKWSHNGFVIGSQSDNAFGSLQNRTYLQGTDGNEESLSSDQQSINQLSIGKYSATYIPSSSAYLKYNSFFKLNDSKSYGEYISFRRDTSILSNKKTNLNYKVVQQLSAYYSPNKSNVFSFEGDVKMIRANPTYDIASNQDLFNNFIPIKTVEDVYLSQNQVINEIGFNAVANYYRIINAKNHFNLSIGATSNMQELDSRIDYTLNEEEPIRLDSSTFSNSNLQRNIWDNYLGVGSKSKIGNIVISPALYAHYYRFPINKLNEFSNSKSFKILPSVKIKWDISSPQSIDFSYKQTFVFPTIDQIATGVVITDYNALFRGRRDLKNGLYHQSNLYYNYFNFFSGMNLFANISYLLKKNDFGNAIIFEGNERLNSLVNLNKANEQLTTFIRFDKKFKQFKINASANLNAYTNYSFVDDLQNRSESIEQKYASTITTTFFKTFDLSIGYEHQLSKYQASRVSNSFINQQPSMRINWTVFKYFNFISAFKHNVYTNIATNSESIFQIFDAHLNFRKPSTPWEFNLSAYNILNTKGIRRDSFTESLISSYEYFIQQRYLVFSVKYDL